MSREAMEDVEVYFKASGIDPSSLYKQPQSTSTSDEDTVAPTEQASHAREGVAQAWCTCRTYKNCKQRGLIVFL